MKYNKHICKFFIVGITIFVGMENHAFSSEDKQKYTSTHGTSGGSCTVIKGGSTSSGTTSSTTHGTSGGSCTSTK